MTNRFQPDRWLDDELARYSNVEPRPGLEHRVLAHVRDTVRAEAVPRRKFWLRWAIVVPAAAMLLFLIDESVPRRPGLQPPSVSRNPLVAAAPPVAALVTESSATARKPRSLARVQPHGALPRLAVFPSPEPLAPQEKLLFTAVREAPHVVAEIGARPGPLQPPAPLEIQPIKLTPLSEPEVPGGSK